MFYDSSQFKVLEAGAKLSWMQQELSTQNLANIETPGYKSKSLKFDNVLKSVQEEADSPEISRISASVVTDESSTQPDENNVDLETESIALYKAYSQYSMFLRKIDSEFDKYNYVLNSNM